MRTMKRKIGKLDPQRLQQALERPAPDPLDPKMVEIVKGMFKPEAAEQYIKSWKAKRSARKG